MSNGGTQKRGLGRGFEALIPTQIVEQEFDPTAKSDYAQAKESSESIRQVAPDLISPNPMQPRQDFDSEALAGLAASVKQYGIVQPLVVTELSGGGYELIAGERRLRASKLAELVTVPVIVRSSSDQEKLELALIENLQRADLNPIETATSYRKLIDQFNLTNDQIGRRVGKDDSTIANSLRLLNLPLGVKRAVVAKKITEGHARAILMVPENKRMEVFEMIVRKGWTVREAERFARDFKQSSATTTKSVERIAETNELTVDLAQYLGTKVTMARTAKGGKLMIEFYSDEELERIYEAIRKSA